MSPTAHAAPASFTTIEPTLLPDGPIIVASAGAPSSDAAFPLAHALAESGHAEIMTLSIIEPFDTPLYGVDGIVFNAGTVPETNGERESQVHAQALRMVPDAERRPVVVRIGKPAEEIARAAREARARLVVVGRGHHHGIDRVLGGDAILRLLQLGDTPVLAAHPGLTAAPRQVVIATDFSPFSHFAAEVAMTLIAPDAHVSLVHVAPEYDETVPFLRGTAERYAKYAATAFEEMHHALHDGVRDVEDVILTGGIGDRIVEFATERRADLVVTATHGRGFLRRMVLGSVGATLLQRSPCSVLAVPGSARTIAMSRARIAHHVTTRAFERHALDAELADFTTRNRRRPCSVEIDSTQLGAQVLAHGLPLVGASFDRHADTVSMMFGTAAAEGTHLTHTITGVTGIDLSQHGDGHDAVLRIAHPGGQTLVMLG